MNRYLPLLLLAVAVACQDAAILQPGAGAPYASMATLPSIVACPVAADVVVNDEAGLRNEVANASPGDVVGLDGMIGLTGLSGADDLRIWVDGLTLTCATSGSGLYMQPGSVLDYLIRAFAPGVTVDRLVLDGTGTNRGPYWASYNGISVFGEDVRFSNNIVTCGSGECAFFTGTARAMVVDNYFETPGSLTGVHLQRVVNNAGDEFLVDASVIRGNTVIATGPAPPDPLDRGPIFGGIRARDGQQLVISDNIVEGPWTNSVSLQHLRWSEVERNQLRGALSFGIGTSLNEPAGGFEDWDWVNEVVFRNNRVTEAGGPNAPYQVSGGAVFHRACGNTLFGNNLSGNFDDLGVLFYYDSGANTLVGNQNVALDIGDLDCDGDLTVDPNIITGRGAVLNGVKLGPIVGGTAQATGGVILR